MKSAETEIVDFSDSVISEGNVEFWMLKIEEMMIKSLYDITFRALNEYPVDGLKRDTWFFDYPAQPVLTVDLVKWTNLCEQAILDIEQGVNKRALEEFYEFSILQIAAMVDLVRGNLTGLQRTMMGAIIVLDVHS
jgi:dynein heavy chain